MQLEIHQGVFIVFYAIFWGAVANVQPRWKAFQWPLFFKLRVVAQRVMVAFLLFNILPAVYFGFTLWFTSGRGPTDFAFTPDAAAKMVIQGILPAFGIFGLYRIWLGLAELRPQWFYKKSVGGCDGVPEEYCHVEPTYRLEWEKSPRQTPVVDLGPRSGHWNLLAALFYFILAIVLPWLFS